MAGGAQQQQKLRRNRPSLMRQADVNESCVRFVFIEKEEDMNTLLFFRYFASSFRVYPVHTLTY